MSEVKRIPVATLTLILASMAAAFATFFMPELLESYAFDPRSPSALDAFACIFLHANLIHLLGNMIFLASVGPAVEFAIGLPRFLATFLVGGVAGVLVHWMFTVHSAQPPLLVGGSGAIAACVAFFSVRYINLRVPIAPKLAAPVWGIALVWATLQAVGAVVRLNDPGAAAYWTHLGGFAVGLLLSFFFQAPKLATLEFGHDVLDRMNARSPGAALTAAELHLRDHPNDVRATIEVANAHRHLGHLDEEADALMKWVHLEPGNAAPIERLAELGRLGAISTLQRSKWAEEFRTRKPELARVLLRSIVVLDDDEPQKPDAMLALAELDLRDRDEDANSMLAELAERFPFHAATQIARTKGLIG